MFFGSFVPEMVKPLHDVKTVTRIKDYFAPHIQLTGIIMQIERSPASSPFERQLAEAAGVEPDNKVVYEVVTDDGSTFYVKVHDMHLTYALAHR
ncbi:MAG: hypothetical protein WA030_03185 [Candidatus Microsaccharimonas sp.]